VLETGATGRGRKGSALSRNKIKTVIRYDLSLSLSKVAAIARRFLLLLLVPVFVFQREEGPNARSKSPASSIGSPTPPYAPPPPPLRRLLAAKQKQRSRSMVVAEKRTR
ncbi:unnamed protein product, partial [Musa acuminata subsp. burmannicoides]